jgi:hypothetical protein
MVNPISANITHTNQAPKPASPKPQQPQQKSAPQPSDTVTLKGTGSANNGNCNH